MRDDSITSSVENENVFLTDHVTSRSGQKWDLHRSSTQDLAKTFLSGERFHQKQSARMHQCSGYLSFAWTEPDQDGVMQLKLKKAIFCHVRSCPVCQWRRSLMWQSKIFSVLPRIAERFPTHRWLMLTLTVKNCPVTELKSTIKIMQAAFSRLTKRKRWPAHGYIKSLEVTRGEDGSAHPHFHILLLVPSSYFGYKNVYLSKYKWAELWMECLRIDYFPVVDVRIIKSKDPKNPRDVSAAVVEVVKYETKLVELQNYPEFLLEMAKQLVKVRSIEVGGLVKDFLKAVSENKEMEEQEKIDSEDKEEKESLMIFGWNRKIKRYTRKR